jgi:glycosyltransferase involved in cell wall biosynthesis
MRMLMELRPALEGFAGIPQETRLLFSYLQDFNGDLKVDGLINSFHTPYRPRQRKQKIERIHEQARYILSVNQRPPFERRWVRYFYYLSVARRFLPLAAKSFLGSNSPLMPFDGELFYDFIWQRLFSKTLPPELFNDLLGRSYYMNALGWYEMHQMGVMTGYYPVINTDQWDLALMQTPFPGRVSANTKLIIRYHDAIPIYFPQHISDAKRHMTVHYHALRANAKQAWFVCTSPPVQNDIVRLLPELEKRVFVIPDMVSGAFFSEPPASKKEVNDMLRRFVAHETQPTFVSRREEERFYATLRDPVYIMAVATLEPRKNYARLLAAWEELYMRSDGEIKLVIVGEMGWDWDRDREHQKMKKWTERGALFHLARVPVSALRKLYSGALAVVCPSISEGFDYSGIEAMRCGAPVLASDIPTHRAVYAEAARYFNPYSTYDLLNKLEKTTTQEWDSEKLDLIKKGERVAAKYSKEAIIPQWHELLNSLKTARA